MGRAHDQADVTEQAAHVLEHLLADDVWVSITARSSLGERSGLVDDLVGDRDLADVVEQRRELEPAQLVLVESHRRSDRHHELHDVAAVAPGVTVVRLDHVAEE